MSGPDVAAVVAGLSEAQRAALMSRGHPIPPMGPFGHESVILSFEHGRVAKKLHALGLADLPFAPQILTAKGMAVRDALRGGK